MSAFLVCWLRDGASLAPQAAATIGREIDAAIAASPAAHRRSAPRTRHSGNVWCWHWAGAWAPGAEDALPMERGGWIGSGVLRLDDRDTLAGHLRDRLGDGAADDATLAWRSLEAWGARAPEHWQGDYAVAAVSTGEGRMVVARGITGVRACFHGRAGTLECVSDDPALIAAVRAVRVGGDAGGETGVSERAIAEYLRHGHLVTPTLSFHVGVRRLPPAHTLVISHDGSTSLQRHWSPPAPETWRGPSDGEVVEAFHAVLDRAVRDRLRGSHAALLLSGGLDSPALGVAARRVAPEVELRALTVSWAKLLDDPEAGFAREAAAAIGLEHQVVEFAPDEGLVGGAPFETPEPIPDPEPRLWRAQARHVAALAPVVLNGEDVDALLSPLTLLEQLRADGARDTLSAWSAYRRDTGMRPWIGLRRQSGMINRWRERRSDPRPDWLRDEALHLLGAPTPGPRPSRPTHATRPRAVESFDTPTWEAALWLDDPAMNGTGHVVLLPFMDPRVIRFCFSLPAVPWAQRKQLLRSALRGAVPDALLQRPKSPVRGYYAARVRAWRASGARTELASPMDAWVKRTAWQSALDQEKAPLATFAAWRVLELSRWLAQPQPGRRR